MFNYKTKRSLALLRITLVGFTPFTMIPENAIEAGRQTTIELATAIYQRNQAKFNELKSIWQIQEEQYKDSIIREGVRGIDRR